jgi:hypothetical protein
LDVVPRAWTADDICGFYARKYRLELASLTMRVLVLRDNYLVGVMRDEKVEQIAVQCIRVEAVPPSHFVLQAGAANVPVKI